MIKVTVWNEYLEELQYEHVAKVYPNGIHECIREFLEKDPEIQVRCVTLRMEDQGLSDEILNDTDVLIWWGHQAHDEVTEENVQRVKQHVLDGMGLIALHSAVCEMEAWGKRKACLRSSLSPDRRGYY